jgi:hypothetical protein
MVIVSACLEKLMELAIIPLGVSILFSQLFFYSAANITVLISSRPGREVT